MKNQKHAKNKKNNLMLNLLIIICIIAILFSLYNIAHWILENKNGNTMLSTIQKQITISSEDVTIDNHTVKKINYDFTNLLSTNPHTIGWINLPNTNIDYPIVKYTDNDYYLNHSFDGSENSAGWVFADYQNKCDGTDYNTVIYAHNRKDKSMFGSLKNVLKTDWYSNEDNLYINFSTLTESHVYKIFSTIVCNDTDVGNYTHTNFSDDTDFLNYVNRLKNASTYKFNTDLTNTSHIITLYTCHGLNNQRLLVYATLVE